MNSIKLKFIDIIYSLGLIFPTISFSGIFFNFFLQPRIELIIFLLKKNIYINKSLFSLLFISLTAIPVLYLNSFLNNTEINSILHLFQYPFAYLWLILVINRYDFKNYFLHKFFELSLILNVIYIFFQFIVEYNGYHNLAMLHSTIPNQINYQIPTDFFFRYTGLYNESSALCFYLSIVFVYFHSQKNILQYLALLLLVFSGSKFAYLFIILWLLINIHKGIFYFFLFFLIVLVSAFLYFYQIKISSGIELRLESLLSSIENIKFIGSGNFQGLDVIGYNFLSYGLFFSILLIFIHIKIILQSIIKKDLILIFFIGLLGNASLAILPHSLLLILAFYTNKIDFLDYKKND